MATVAVRKQGARPARGVQRAATRPTRCPRASRGRLAVVVASKVKGEEDKEAEDSSRSRSRSRKWNVSRFAKQLLFFRTGGVVGGTVRVVTFPFRLAKRMLGRGASPSADGLVEVLLDHTRTRTSEEGEDLVVMVAGATGGVGKRCVTKLLSLGRRVRVLVRDADKARELFRGAGDLAAPGAKLELCAADITQPQTLQPSMFQDVGTVMCTTACKVAPKEGDTDKRDKYYQGIKFFDPEIVGDTPEVVDFEGVKNLVDAFKEKRREHHEQGEELAWGSLDDVVMGGVSESSMEASGENVVFKGIVRTENNGGFASMRTRNVDPALDLSGEAGITLRVRGNGMRFKFLVRTETGFDAVAYASSFDTKDGEWQEIDLPFKDFIPVFRAKTVTGDEAKPLNTKNIVSMQVMLSKFEYDGALNPSFRAGEFELPIAGLRTYRGSARAGGEEEEEEEEEERPRFVYVSSAGVTRPNRPGIDVEVEPPAVKLNDALGGILTYKLKGEDYIRESGLSYCVVRPCALTEEPEGAEIVVEQGDTIRGKISREDVASLMCSMVLEKFDQVKDVTFEVTSTQPFSEPYVQGEGHQPRTGSDWKAILDKANVRRGVTGKTINGKYTGNVPEQETLAGTGAERPLTDAWYSW
ncbi:NAD(P)-binding domain-containing protein [Chloropicon primus]|nr:NAD(P)-binding domain-containing protein [Chloropicon primus]